MQDFAPRWLGDDETAVCFGCHAPFDGWNWRHHCRKCGGIFCDACSPYKCLIHPADVVYPPDWDSLLSTFDPREPLRTCAACREALLPYQDDLRKTCSNASQTTEVDRADVARYLNVPLQFDMRSEIQKATHTLKFLRRQRARGRVGPGPGRPHRVGLGPRLPHDDASGLLLLGARRERSGDSADAGRRWSAPSAVCTAGAGWGLQIGGEVTDMLVVLNSQDAVDAFASTAQDLEQAAWAPRSAWQWARSGGLPRRRSLPATAARRRSSPTPIPKGLFAGVAGSHACVVLARPDCNESFYGADHAVDAISVRRRRAAPRGAAHLYDALDEVLAGGGRFEARRGRGEWLAEAAATRDEYGDASDDPFAPRVDCPSQVAADEALARRLAAEDERPADAGPTRRRRRRTTAGRASASGGGGAPATTGRARSCASSRASGRATTPTR